LNQFVREGWSSWVNPSRIPARGVLGIVSFFGFFVNYMLRVNMNIAIVSMTGGSAATASNASTFVASECLRPDLSNNIYINNASSLDEDSANKQVCASSLILV
jgi:hypothetical protein